MGNIQGKVIVYKYVRGGNIATTEDQEENNSRTVTAREAKGTDTRVDAE